MKSVGKRIREYREKRGLSLQELAEGICSPDTLWRIEKRNFSPSFFILEKISQKLSVPLRYLLDRMEDDPPMKTIRQEMDLCREFVYYEEYELLHAIVEHIIELVKVLEEVPISIHIFIEWHKAILLYRKEENFAEAEDHLRTLLPPTLIPVTELELGIANSLGLVLMKLSRLSEAEEIFANALRVLKELPVLEDYTLYPRITYNLLSIWYQREWYDEVIKKGYLVLYDLYRTHLTYMAGEIHHLLSLTHEKKGQLEEAVDFMERAACFFYTENRYELYLRALRALADVQLKKGDVEGGKENLEKVEKELLSLPDISPMKKKIYEQLMITKRKYDL